MSDVMAVRRQRSDRTGELVMACGDEQRTWTVHNEGQQ